MKVLAIDVGGTHVKILVSGQNEVPEVSVSGPTADTRQDGFRRQGTRQGLGL